MCKCISLYVFKTQHVPSTLELETCLSTEVKLIKAVCSAPKQRVGFTASKTFRKYIVSFVCGRSHSIGTAFASNSEQSIHLYTCVTTTQVIPLPWFSVSVSVLSRCPLRPTNSGRYVLWCVQDTSVTLPRIGDCVHCSMLPILVLSILLSPFTEFSFRLNEVVPSAVAVCG